jgi:ABC-2 type transport system permease protein
MPKFELSFDRLLAVMRKEFIQMRRDRMTFLMMIMIPLLQLILFGYAINTSPRHLPTVVVSAEHTPFTRRYIQGLKNTDYFRIIGGAQTEHQAQRLMAQGKALFIVNIPPNFTQDMLRGARPQILITADATDPVAIGGALMASRVVTENVFNRVLRGPLKAFQNRPPNVDFITHAKYNPEEITALNIVPALIGVVLTMTMIIITSIAITREQERGTMESLLATPVRPLEVMIGKITPYITVGYIQFIFIITAAGLLFHVPIEGSLWLLAVLMLPFIAANLAVGLTFSSIAKNQLQAMQMTFFFFLPSILLSGFLFPFYGMPVWAQWLGQVLPLTHFIRIVRGILLKGNGFDLLWPQLWPILLFMLAALFIGVKRYRQTLD